MQYQSISQNPRIILVQPVDFFQCGQMIFQYKHVCLPLEAFAPNDWQMFGALVANTIVYLCKVYNRNYEGRSKSNANYIISQQLLV